MRSSSAEIRVLARAAAQLAALAHPDLASVLAALPRRPGATASLAEVAHATGADPRAVGRAVARGRDAGVLRVDGDRLGLALDGVAAVVRDLVALTPLGGALAARPDLAGEVPDGLLHGVPTGERARELLAVVAALLPEGDLTEAQVSAELSRLGDDPAGLRRALVDEGLLWRTPDGAVYRRTG